MISRLAHLVVSTTLAGSLLVANASCATRHAEDAAMAPPRFAGQAPDMWRLAQFSFGARAAFGVCVGRACPAVTRKTLAIDGTSPMQAVAHRVASSSDALHEADPPMPMAPVASPTHAAPLAPVDAAIHSAVVAFPSASARLTDQARTALSASIGYARVSDHIAISGRTDSVGDEKVNESLAVARALSVRDYLHAQVPDLAAVISIDAKGRCCFVAPNETEAGRSRNRRVEIAFFSRGGS